MQNIETNIKIQHIKSIIIKDKLAISDKLVDLFRIFNLSALCLKNNMIKFKGYGVSDIISVLTLFPFMAIATVNSFILSRFKLLIDAQKDTFFRLKNNEYYNWRNLLLLFAKRFNKLNSRHSDGDANQSSDDPTCLIVDDSLVSKVGTKIEFIGKVFDHVMKKSVLGFKLLLLAFWDGNSLIPLDFSYHAEQGKNKKYPFGLLKRQLNQRFSKQRRKDAAGYKRAQEMFVDKISNTIALVKRAVKHGFVPDYVLSDSWFSSEKLIKTVRQLKPTHKKRAKKLNAYYIEVIVNYCDMGPVKLFFTRFTKRSKWRLILSTDVNLSFQQAMKIYNVRWTIEVLFKECKQHLNLGKCQSNDFDAQIADTTISLLVYMMLSFHKKIHSYPTLGILFAEYRQQFIEATVAEKLWQLFISLQLTIAAILEIDGTNIMRVIFQLSEVNDMFKSLSRIFLEDNCSIEFNKAA